MSCTRLPNFEATHKIRQRANYFDELSEGQKPEFLYTECSDSRVTAEDLMGVNPGEVFVHRNVANMVVSTDNNVNAVVQYAVEQLHVKHIIVCGHYGCGGINAALHPSDLGQLNSWVQNIRDVYRIHKAEIDGISDQQKQFDRLVELNVREQCINLLKIDHVQKSWYGNGYPKVHGWIFNMRTGYIEDQKLNMQKIFSDVRCIYDLKPKMK